MKLVSIRIITADVKRLVSFYEMVTGAEAVWGNELFAEIPTPVGALAMRCCSATPTGTSSTSSLRSRTRRGPSSGFDGPAFYR